MRPELPDEIPEHLRSLVIAPSEGELDEPAWTPQDALTVVEALVGAEVAVSGGRVFRREAWGTEPTNDEWSCERLPGEGVVEYVHRCRGAAIDYIQTYGEDHGGSVCFVLNFTRF